jgi:excisionase family DNA binding protein
VNKGKHH